MKREVQFILSFLEHMGVEAYIVGGYVRDFFLNHNSYDIDIAANASYERLLHILSPFSPRIEFESFTFVKNHYTFQITPFRKEMYDRIHRRSCKTIYTSKVSEDVLRRDFTINAIYMDKDGNCIDLVNGIEDIKRKSICCIGDAYIRMKEDPLRILRAIRFASMLQFNIEPTLSYAIKENICELKRLSFARIKMEIERFYPYHIHAFAKYICEYQLFSILHIVQLPVYTPTIEGFWAHFDIKGYPFSKRQRKKIEKIQFYVGKRIEKEDLIDCSLKEWKTICILKGISYKKLVDVYTSLPIHSIREVKIPYHKLSFYPIGDIKKDILYQIINRKINNVPDEILQYVTTKYNKLSKKT